MTDITERLRSIYVAEGSNYVQEAADLIECLRAERKALVNDVHSCHAGCQKAGCVNVRLREALQDVFIGIGMGGSAYEISQRTTPIIRAALGETK
jgi:hypothetical protein